MKVEVITFDGESYTIGVEAHSRVPRKHHFFTPANEKNRNKTLKNCPKKRNFAQR